MGCIVACATSAAFSTDLPRKVEPIYTKHSTAGRSHGMHCGLCNQCCLLYRSMYRSSKKSRPYTDATFRSTAVLLRARDGCVTDVLHMHSTFACRRRGERMLALGTGRRGVGYQS